MTNNYRCNTPVLWDGVFRNVQIALENLSFEIDMWLEDLYYLYIDPGYDAVGIIDDALGEIAWEIHYTHENILSGIRYNSNKSTIESDKLKYAYLVQCYNTIVPWWLPKKEYYNDEL